MGKSAKKSATKSSASKSTKKAAVKVTKKLAKKAAKKVAKKVAPKKTAKRKTAQRKTVKPLLSLSKQSSDYDESASSLLPPDYEPSEAEEYMNSLQLEYFRRKLAEWKETLLEESQETLGHLRNETVAEADVIDRAVQETNHALELRTRDRYRKLIIKIDEALHRIANSEYGYCEDTGNPIGIRRLQVRPIATLCLEAQEAHERKERKS